MADQPLNPYLSNLKGKHQKLSQRVSAAEKSPACADFYLKQLKRQKLLIKDKMFTLMDDLEARKANLC